MAEYKCSDCGAFKAWYKLAEFPERQFCYTHFEQRISSRAAAVLSFRDSLAMAAPIELLQRHFSNEELRRHLGADGYFAEKPETWPILAYAWADSMLRARSSGSGSPA